MLRSGPPQTELSGCRRAPRLTTARLWQPVDLSPTKLIYSPNQECAAERAALLPVRVPGPRNCRSTSLRPVRVRAARRVKPEQALAVCCVRPLRRLTRADDRTDGTVDRTICPARRLSSRLRAVSGDRELVPRRQARFAASAALSPAHIGPWRRIRVSSASGPANCIIDHQAPALLS